jgi:hypothetical protein
LYTMKYLVGVPILANTVSNFRVSVEKSKMASGDVSNFSSLKQEYRLLQANKTIKKIGNGLYIYNIIVVWGSGKRCKTIALHRLSEILFGRDILQNFF